MKQTAANPPKMSRLPHPVHKIGLNNIPVFFFFALYLQLSFLFWQLGRSVRERGEEGSCLSGVDISPSEGCDSDHRRDSRFTIIRRKCRED